jgi:hypothetical protein
MLVYPPYQEVNGVKMMPDGFDGAAWLASVKATNIGGFNTDIRKMFVYAPELFSDKEIWSFAPKSVYTKLSTFNGLVSFHILRPWHVNYSRLVYCELRGNLNRGYHEPHGFRAACIGGPNKYSPGMLLELNRTVLAVVLASVDDIFYHSYHRRDPKYYTVPDKFMPDWLAAYRRGSLTDETERKLLSSI